MRDIVVYIGSMVLPDKSAGAQRALSLSKSFRDLGYHVALVGMEKGEYNAHSVLETKTNCQGFDAFAVPQPCSIKDWVHHTISVKEFLEVIEHYGANRVKCVVAMEYEAIPLARLAWYCRKHGIALIADAEEWYEHSRMQFPMNLAKDLDTTIRMHFVYPYMIKNMICISQFFYDHYQKRISNRVVIPGTIDQDECKWENCVYTPNSVLTLGYAGNPGLQFEKERLDRLIQAVMELNQEGNRCRLILAGVENQFLQERIPSYVQQQNDQWIVCQGQISHVACLEIIASCDFTVIVRENKRVTNAGFPTKLSESFGCGTPVLTTKTSNIAEYIPDRQWGIVCDGYDVDSIKIMIRKAMKYDSEELIEIHKRIKQENPLTYEGFNQRLELFLAKLL